MFKKIIKINNMIISIALISVLVSVLSYIKVVYTNNSEKINGIIENNTDFLLSVGAGLIGALSGGIVSYSYKKLRTKTKKSYKIFISNSSKNASIAKEISKKLKEVGLKTYLAEEDLKVGDNIIEQLYKNLNDSSILLLLLSNESINSRFVNEEIDTAMKNKLSVLPIVIDKNIKIPDKILNIKFLDWTDNNYDYNQIIDSIYNLNLKKPNASTGR